MNQILHITNSDELKRYYATLPDRISSVTEYIGIIEHRWVMNIPYFRGEPEIYPKPCLPGIWRGVDESQYSKNTWTDKEQEEVEKFKGKVLSGDLNDPYIDTTNPPSKNSIEWLELAQHYGHPTRLLDVTLDPLVALFFGVSKSPYEDGCVYLSNGSSFNTLDPGEYETGLDKFFEIYSLRGYSPLDDTLFFYRPLAKNRRMIAQRGQFVWCRAIGKSLKATDTRIVISSDAKSEIKIALDRMGYSEENLLPPGIYD
jgi:hypothetical protein